MKPKDWISKQTKERTLRFFGSTQLNNSQEVTPWFLGKINSDRTKITDSTGKVYNLSFTGNPKEIEIALRLDNNNAVVYSPDLQFFQTDSSQAPGLVASRDGTWLFLRYLGDNRKFYLPIHESFSGLTSVGNYQVRFSSDGNAVLIGTVVEDPEDHHQMAVYGCYRDIQLVTYNQDTINQLPSLAALNYPIPPGDESYVTFGTPIGFNILDLNSYTDGKVPVPDLAGPGSDSMMFPYGYLGSLNYDFTVQTDFNWETEAGLQESTFGPVALASDKSYGNQSFVWESTPNSSLFQSYTYVFNNDTQGNYRADILTDHVNCYMFGLVSTNWTEGYELYNLIPSAPSEVTLSWAETLVSEFTYLIPSDYAYHLIYLQQPDLWVSDVDITVVPQHHTWDSDGRFIQIEPNNNININDSWVFDKVARDYTAFPPDGAFSSSGRVYRLFYTTGYPLPQFNDVADSLNVSYYNGVGRQFNPSGIFAYFGNYYRDYSGLDPGVNTGLTSGYYMDINFDSAFPITIFPFPIIHTIFSGRSMTAITNLLDNPSLYGIVTQKLGDGNDYDLMIKGFRGRSPSNVENTAYVYQQQNSSIYFYSSPYLMRGNLSGIGGGQVELSVNSGVYSQAIAALVTLGDYANVYDDPTLQNQINQAIGFYQNKTAAPQDLLNAIYAGTLALTEDLAPTVNQLKSVLADLNSAINGDMSLLGPDVIGYEPPDVFSDRIFSFAGTWPIYNGGFLKAVDSYIVQELYTSEGSEYIQTYNVAPDGLTTFGKASGSSIQNGCNTSLILDYILPIKPGDTQG